MNMDYDLTRIDYAICGVTYPDTLKILPASGQKTEQKVKFYKYDQHYILSSAQFM